MGRKVESVTEPLEIYVLFNAMAVHSVVADAADPAVEVLAGSAQVGNVA